MKRHMTRDGVLKRGREKVDKAKKIARDCPSGYFVFFDRKASRVFYRDAHSPKEILTDFTEEHIDIAHREFSDYDPAFLRWDKLNSEQWHGKFDVYTVKGK